MTDTFKPVERVEFLGHGGKKVSPNLVDAIRKKAGPETLTNSNGGRDQATGLDRQDFEVLVDADDIRKRLRSQVFYPCRRAKPVSGSHN